MFSFWEAHHVTQDNEKKIEDFLAKHPEAIDQKCEPAELTSLKLGHYLNGNVASQIASGIIAVLAEFERSIQDFQGFNRYQGMSLLEIAANSNANNTGLMLARRGAELTERLFKYAEYHIDFFRTLAHYYEHESTDRDHLSKALMCYVAIKSRTDIKRIDRKIFNHGLGKYHKDPINGQNALHRAAIFGFKRQYLTLLHLHAPTFVRDKQNKWPGDYLTEEQKDQINQITLHYQDLNLPTIDAIMRAITFTEPGEHNIKLALENVYQLPAIKPLLDFAKFAVIGQHRLSGRFTKREVDEEYDSDEEAPIENANCLSITLDPNESSIIHMQVTGKDGLGYISTVGLCTGGRNRLYAGIKRPVAEAIGTIIHEICHYTALEVFRCFEPYRTTEDQKRFQAIADELSKSVKELPDLLQIPFENYGSENIHNELIVRVPQIIAAEHMNGHDGIALLNARPDTKQLYDYYEQTFLPAIATHVEKLTARAFHHWNPEIFKPK